MCNAITRSSSLNFFHLICPEVESLRNSLMSHVSLVLLFESFVSFHKKNDVCLTSGNKEIKSEGLDQKKKK